MVGMATATAQEHEQ